MYSLSTAAFTKTVIYTHFFFSFFFLFFSFASHAQWVEIYPRRIFLFCMYVKKTLYASSSSHRLSRLSLPKKKKSFHNFFSFPSNFKKKLDWQGSLTCINGDLTHFFLLTALLFIRDLSNLPFPPKKNGNYTIIPSLSLERKKQVNIRVA